MRRVARGTTLMELMAVVGIISVLASIAIGFTGSFRREETIKEIARNIVSGMAQGRAEAVRRSTRVHVDFVSAGLVAVSAYTDRAGNFRWDQGVDGVKIFEWPKLTDPAIPLPQPVISGPALLAVNGQLTAIFDLNGNSIDRTGRPLAALLCVKDARLPRATRAVQLTAAGAARILSYAEAVALCP